MAGSLGCLRSVLPRARCMNVTDFRFLVAAVAVSRIVAGALKRPGSSSCSVRERCRCVADGSVFDYFVGSILGCILICFCSTLGDFGSQRETNMSSKIDAKFYIEKSSFGGARPPETMPGWYQEGGKGGGEVNLPPWG